MLNLHKSAMYCFDRSAALEVLPELKEGLWPYPTSIFPFFHEIQNVRNSSADKIWGVVVVTNFCPFREIKLCPARFSSKIVNENGEFGAFVNIIIASQELKFLTDKNFLTSKSQNSSKLIIKPIISNPFLHLQHKLKRKTSPFVVVSWQISVRKKLGLKFGFAR